ncbi:ornithine cyclodeaminase/alanine dehydrogenase [Actinoplanes lutulentus]|uniref:Ornithine cyclodeaminase/alanine dehydrogenase n=1 Tax=Actinoplanes lutulentus TaxID=1287878 RepID=A0A327ZB10_9ACTN|nr:ornithine cyclodeaminase family protein [Actinoplanes lutulentus]MBB2947216.1 ornithine cyclodeaminase/alanine dehydrogenase [Actinoplanes lutulentus]RAK36491.1 ornithine cyclodeaminase/alanine dehydrogenase [Actinoplanes lutulentus]
MTLVLTHSDVARLLRGDPHHTEVRAAVERAHADLARGRAVVPAPPAMTLDGAALIPMAAADGASGRAAVKLLADIPGNRAAGLPVQRSAILVSSATTGECQALIDGRLVTAVRTAAVSAVATAHLSRPDSRVLGLVGAGNLAIEHTRAIVAVRDIDTVVVWSRSSARVSAYREAVAGLGLTVKAVDTVEEVVRAADVLCTQTPAREPLVHGAWFEPGLHVNAVGAPPRTDHREIDGSGMRRAYLVVDSLPTALSKSGEVVMALAENAITTADVRVELGEVIAGLAPGRTTPQDITLFNSVGIGLQDLVTADLLLKRAREEGIGTTIDLAA